MMREDVHRVIVSALEERDLVDGQLSHRQFASYLIGKLVQAGADIEWATPEARTPVTPAGHRSTMWSDG